MAEHRRRPPGGPPPCLTLIATVSRAFSVLLLLLQLFLLLSLMNGIGGAAAAGPCEIAFRLDDIQEYWITESQEAVISRFLSSRIPLTLGVIASTLNQGDEQLATFLRNAVANNTAPSPATTAPPRTSTPARTSTSAPSVGRSTTRAAAASPSGASSSPTATTRARATGDAGSLLEVGCHGWRHVDFSQLTLQQQVTEFTNCKSILASYFPGSPSVTTFIAPYNAYNQNTITAMTSTGYQAISAIDDCPLPNNTASSIRHYPTGASTSYTGGEVGFGDSAPASFTISQIQSQLSQCSTRSGANNTSVSFSVVMLHPQEFAQNTNGGLNQSALGQLDILLRWSLQQSGCALRLIRDLSATLPITNAPNSSSTPPTTTSPATTAQTSSNSQTTPSSTAASNPSPASNLSPGERTVTSTPSPAATTTPPRTLTQTQTQTQTQTLAPSSSTLAPTGSTRAK